MTLADLITSVTGAITGFVPDLAIYIAGGVVISLVGFAVRRLVKSGR